MSSDATVGVGRDAIPAILIGMKGQVVPVGTTWFCGHANQSNAVHKDITIWSGRKTGFLEMKRESNSGTR